MTTTSDPEPGTPGFGVRPEDAVAEDVEDAFLDGDRAFEAGTARAAFSHRTFRTVYLGAFASNIGTWMQNVVLGALAWHLTKSHLYLGLIAAAQLGPLLLFSVFGGMIADQYDRKKSLLLLCLQQAVFSVLLAVVTVPKAPNETLLLVIVLIIGIGNALYAPIFSAVVPILVPRRDLPGAISLNSVQMNASRVIGPLIGAPIYAAFGPSWVFVLNALSFGFVLLALTRVTLPAPTPSGTQGWHRVVEGFRVAARDRVVGQSLIVIAVFSFWCLPWIPQLAAIADENLGIDSDSGTFGLLYGCFGFGAVLGALSIGTIFAGTSKPFLTRIGLVGFAGLVFVFGTMHVTTAAFAAIIVLGAVYFAVITSLSTVLQQALDDSVRGKVMALWIMGFGGMVPFGGIVGGKVIEQWGITPMIAICSVVSLALAWWADLLPSRPSGVFAVGSTTTRPLP